MHKVLVKGDNGVSCNPPEELLQSLHPLAEELIAEVVKVLEQLLTRERLDRGGRGRGQEWEEEREKGWWGGEKRE